MLFTAYTSCSTEKACSTNGCMVFPEDQLGIFIWNGFALPHPMHVPFKPPSLQATRSQSAAKNPCLFVAWWSRKVKDFDGLAFSGGPARQQGCERRRIWPCPKIAWDLSDERPGM